jgi:hypothetical protein
MCHQKKKKKQEEGSRHSLAACAAVSPQSASIITEHICIRSFTLAVKITKNLLALCAARHSKSYGNSTSIIKRSESTPFVK